MKPIPDNTDERTKLDSKGMKKKFSLERGKRLAGVHRKAKRSAFK